MSVSKRLSSYYLFWSPFFHRLVVLPSVCKLFTFSLSSRETLSFGQFLKMWSRITVGQFQQTRHTVFLGEGKSSLFKWRVTSLPKVRQLLNSKKIFTTELLKNLLQKHWANFNETSHKHHRVLWIQMKDQVIFKQGDIHVIKKY